MNLKSLAYNSYARHLQGCINTKSVTDGKRIHGHIIKTGFKTSVFLSNLLLNMYAKCGSVVDALQVLDEMPERNLVSWTAMISGYSQNGYNKEALHLFEQMQYDGMKPNQFTITSVLGICANLTSLGQGRQVHAHIFKSGFDSDVFVGSSLVHMYARCEQLTSARHVFDKMTKRNIVTWNAMIVGYTQQCCYNEALQLFRQMRPTGIKPNCITFTNILCACFSSDALKSGQQIHSHAIKNGFDLDIFVRSALICMYAKSDCLDDARQLFDKICKRDAVLWTAMIAGYVQNGDKNKSFQLIQQMQQAGLKLNHISLTCILGACSSPEALKHGKQVHTHFIKTGYELKILPGNALVTMYAKCDSVEDGWRVFHRMPKRDEVSWTAMIAGYAQSGYGEDAFKLLYEMQKAGMKPDHFTLASVLTACSSLAAMEMGKLVHVCIIRAGYETDVFVGNTLVEMYAKCGNIGNARKVFEGMPIRDSVSWNEMIGAYSQNGHGKEALELFFQMLRSGMDLDRFTFGSVLSACVSLGALELGMQVHAYVIKIGRDLDAVVGNTLVHMYAKYGTIREAHTLFSQMPQQNEVLWTAMIGAYARHGHGEEALKLLCHMQRAGIKPNQFTLTSITRACTSMAAVEQGSLFHGHVIKAGLERDAFVGSALVDMYAKCGNIDNSWILFDKMPQRDVVLWNVMISGYAQHGRGREAFQLLEQMQQAGLKPDHITFVGILSACRHLGLVKEGHYYFNSMSLDHAIRPRAEHYACMVDLLSRAGCLDEAVNFINKMPFEPDAIIWQTLLGACRTYGNMDLGKFTAECVFNTKAEDAAAYVQLSNIYAEAGRWDDVAKVRKVMKDRRIKKEPGCSWIEVKNRVHAFVVGDRSHPRMEEIYAQLEKLTEQMKKVGYVPKTNFIVHDIEQKQN